MEKKEPYFRGTPNFPLDSPSSCWLVERDGKPVAILYEPEYEDMFWFRFRIEPISEDLQERNLILSSDFWDAEKAIAENYVYVNCQSGRPATYGLLGGKLSFAPGSVSMRGLIGPFCTHQQDAATENPGDTEARARFRFGISTLLIITAMYAVLFGILRASGASTLVFVVVAAFFTVVGLCQKLLYRGRQRQWASVIAGVCFFEALLIIKLVLLGKELLPFCPFDPAEGAFFGAVYGYLAGILIAVVFLVTDNLKNVQARSRG